MTDTQPMFDLGTEVTITITGRVIGSGPGIAVEYLKANGFADRLHVHAGPGVSVASAPPPSVDELYARERAARMVACAFTHPEESVSAQREWVDRWNDAYPVDAKVRVTVDGLATETRMVKPAFLADGVPVALLADDPGLVALRAVEPITETA